MSAIDDLPPLREVIRQHALSARKSLGQNFLLDLNLTARIARAAGPLEAATIIEVGPGPGGLTRALLAMGARRVIAVERDDEVARFLAGLLEGVHDDDIGAGDCFVVEFALVGVVCADGVDVDTSFQIGAFDDGIRGGGRGTDNVGGAHGFARR